MKLIDASKLKKMMTATLVQSRWDRTPDEEVMAIEVAVSVINELLDCVPVVDAAPVVHARWACDEDFNTVCTGCGRNIPTFHCYNEETYEEWDEPIDKTPFCPNCGAKMDGGGDDAADCCGGAADPAGGVPREEGGRRKGQRED